MVSGTNDRWLTADFAIRTVYPKAEPYLWWLDMFPKIPENQPTYMYRSDDVGAANDPKKKRPATQRVGGKFPEIDFSNPSVIPGIVEAKGFSYRVPADLLRGPPNSIRNLLVDAYNKSGYWLAEAINSEILSSIKSGASTPDWSPVAAWSEFSANPSKDLIGLEGAMIQDGYPFRLNQTYVHKNNWVELKERLADVDSSGNARAIWNATMSPDPQTIVEPYSNVPVTYMMSDIPEGAILGLDKNNPVVEVHYFNDPEFAVPTIRYPLNGNTDNATQWKTIPNFGLGFFQYKENDTHDLILQFKYDLDPVVTNSKGLLYKPSGL